MGRSSNSLSTHRAPLSCLAIVPNFCEVVPFVAPAINQTTTLEVHLQSILPQTSLLNSAIHKAERPPDFVNSAVKHSGFVLGVGLKKCN